MVKFAGGVTWTPDPEGEYNAHVAEIGGKVITVYSDRDGTTWEYTVDDGDIRSLDADDLDAALREAAREVKQ